MDFSSIAGESYHAMETASADRRRREVGETPSRGAKGERRLREVESQVDDHSYDPCLSSAAFSTHLKELFEKAGL